MIDIIGGMMTTREMLLISTDIKELEEQIETLLHLAKKSEMKLTIMEIVYAILILDINRNLSTYTIRQTPLAWKERNNCSTHNLYMHYQSINVHIKLAIVDLIKQDKIICDGIDVMLTANLKNKELDTKNIDQILRMIKNNRDLVLGDINEIM